jgi:transposase
LWRTRAGAPWRDLPAEYGRWQTVYNRQRRWSADGTWATILDHLRRGCDADEGAQWTVAVDSMTARAHQHAAGARREPPVLAHTEGCAELQEPAR